MHPLTQSTLILPSPMTPNQPLSDIAHQKGIRYFLISFTDLLGCSGPSWYRRRRSTPWRRMEPGLRASRPG
jgi:hypothetical protein